MDALASIRLRPDPKSSNSHLAKAFLGQKRLALASSCVGLCWDLEILILIPPKVPQQPSPNGNAQDDTVISSLKLLDISLAAMRTFYTASLFLGILIPSFARAVPIISAFGTLSTLMLGPVITVIAGVNVARFVFWFFWGGLATFHF